MEAGLLSPIDRLRYRTQQAVLLNVLTAPVFVWQRLTAANLPRPDAAALEALRDRLSDLLERDLENADAGIYPRDLLFRFSVGDYVRHLPALLTEPPRAAWRRWRHAWDDLPDEAIHEGMPDYYRRTFHWQSDGWLSDRSASLYDMEVESLFGGTADVMRRMAIPPLVERFGPEGKPRILDVACGTGRFLQQLRATLPHAELAGVDLSPHYLAYAHRGMSDGRPVSFVAENAEHLSYRGAHFDAVTCVFLFHELPAEVRRRVAREMRRVLRPGGTLVLCDSAQVHDDPALEPILAAFPKVYHEPYYTHYMRDPLEGILEETGFEVESTQPAFLSKVVVATRPD